MTYELVTILLIVGAGLAGTSEVTKNKLVAYPGFAVIIYRNNRLAWDIIVTTFFLVILTSF
jgi:hypothetical protein